jgi:hypothetical protein
MVLGGVLMMLGGGVVMFDDLSLAMGTSVRVCAAGPGQRSARRL